MVAGGHVVADMQVEDGGNKLAAVTDTIFSALPWSSVKASLRLITVVQLVLAEDDDRFEEWKDSFFRDQHVDHVGVVLAAAATVAAAAAQQFLFRHTSLEGNR